MTSGVLRLLLGCGALSGACATIIDVRPGDDLASVLNGAADGVMCCSSPTERVCDLGAVGVLMCVSCLVCDPVS